MLLAISCELAARRAPRRAGPSSACRRRLRPRRSYTQLRFSVRAPARCSEDRRVRAPRRRLLSRLAQPGRRPVGLSRRGGRPPAAARLRARACSAPAAARAVAAPRRDRHHPLPPRPLGRPRAVGLRRPLRRGPRAGAARALAAARAARETLHGLDPRPRCERDPRALRRARVRGGDAVRGRRLRATSRTACSTTRSRATGCACRTAAGRSPTAPTPRRATGSSSSPATPTSSSARRPWPSPSRASAATSPRTRRSTAYRASGAQRLVVIHRPDELPLPDGVERAYDGARRLAETCPTK